MSQFPHFRAEVGAHSVSSQSITDDAVEFGWACPQGPETNAHMSNTIDGSSLIMDYTNAEEDFITAQATQSTTFPEGLHSAAHRATKHHGISDEEWEAIAQQTPAQIQALLDALSAPLSGGSSSSGAPRQ